MRILVTGLNGQVAKSLAERGRNRGRKVALVGRDQVDLASFDPNKFAKIIARERPDVIISAAAYTAVDKAESEPELAYAVNANAPGQLAASADKMGIPLIHLSTDYVFAGGGSAPWREDDPTAPKSVYGASKLEGEKFVQAATDNCVILRTAWVYSPFGANFVKTMLRLASSRNEVGVVADQFGNPTSSLDIADGILAVSQNLISNQDRALRGVFHMVGSGESSWAEFAEAIFAASVARGGPVAKVRHIATSDYPTPAARPNNSRLDCSKLLQLHGVKLPHWEQSLDTVLERLIDSGEYNQ